MAREALVEFTSRVNDPHVVTRRTVAFHLPSVIDEDNVDPAAAVALEILSRDPDADTRYFALHALIEEGLDLERPWLEGIAARLVHDPDLLVRQLALNFLPPSPELYEPWTSSELVDAGAQSDDEWVHWNYVSELIRRGDRDSADAALAALIDSLPQTRRFGAWVLGQFGDGPVLERPDRGRSIAALMAAAASETDEQVIDFIASALCWLRAAESVPWLIGLCRTGGDELRTSLALSLTNFAVERADIVAALTALVADPVPSVRDWASFAFSNTLTADSPELRENLLALVRDPDRATAAQAIIALCTRGDRRAIPALADALKQEPDNETWILVEAAQSLPDPGLLDGLHRLARSAGYQDEPELGALIEQIERQT
jgi:HEAT repeat protein